MRLRIITINTDASFDPATGAAGYGIWITTTEKRLFYSGSFKNTMRTCGEAEKAAIINGLFIVASEIEGEFDRVVINTDSKEAIHHFNNRDIKKDQYNHGFGQWCNQIKKKLNVKRIKIKHVKGHSQNTNARKFVNNWCDLEAKKHMKKKRQSIQDEKAIS